MHETLLAVPLLLPFPLIFFFCASTPYGSMEREWMKKEERKYLLSCKWSVWPANHKNEAFIPTHKCFPHVIYPMVDYLTFVEKFH